MEKNKINADYKINKINKILNIVAKSNYKMKTLKTLY